MFVRNRNPEGQSGKVQRKTKKARELNELAEIAERVYRAKRQPAYRALALEKIRFWSSVFGAFAMIGFGAWSSVGVHAGVTKGGDGTASESFAGWILEPVILACVAGIMILRAALARAGARLNRGVWLIEFGLIGLSFAANINALPAEPTTANYVMRLAGPIGCLFVSVGLVLADVAIRNADIDIAREVSDDSANRWAGVRERVADTVSTATGRFVDTVADKLGGVSTDSASAASRDSRDTSVDTRVDASTDSSVDVHVDTPQVSTDSVPAPASTVSTSTTSADSRVDSDVDRSQTASVDSSTAARGQQAQVSTAPVDSDVDATATTAQMPTVQTLTTVDGAMDKVRELIDTEGVDTVTALSVRGLAGRLDCSKTTADKARKRVLDELAQQPQDDEPELVASGTEA